jgi:hypothetical protein
MSVRTLINGSMWSFVGVALTVAFFYWSVYRNPFSFQITVDDEFDLVDVRERIEDLQILYKSEDILNTPKAVKVLRLTLRNAGETILPSHYDETEPFGLRFPNASVLNAYITDSNSNYLKAHLLRERNAKPVVSGQYTEQPSSADLPLEKVIFEKGKFATMKIYLLQEKKEPINVQPMGKIANIEELHAQRRQPEERPQALVPVLSFLAAYVGMILAPVTMIWVLGARSSRRRRARLRAFLGSYPVLSADEQAIVDAYRRRWSGVLSRLVRRLAAGDDVIDVRDSLKDEIAALFRDRPFPFRLLIPPSLRYVSAGEPTGLPREIFVREGTSVRFNPHNEAFVREFFRAMGTIPEVEQKELDTKA